MRLYLVQHGLARPESEDPKRPLTPAGREEVLRVARAAAAAGVRPGQILHSGKLRARQTAEILAERLRPADGVHAIEGLDPQGDPRVAAERVAQADADLMLVGHLPHLGRLTSLLVAGSAEWEIVAFRNAGVVCLEGKADRFAVVWILTPELLAP